MRGKSPKKPRALSRKVIWVSLQTFYCIKIILSLFYKVIQSNSDERGIYEAPHPDLQPGVSSSPGALKKGTCVLSRVRDISHCCRYVLLLLIVLCQNTMAEWCSRQLRLLWGSSLQGFNSKKNLRRGEAWQSWRHILTPVMLVVLIEMCNECS